MESTNNAKIRVRLESFNHQLLVLACQKIITMLSKSSSSSIGNSNMVTLPTTKRIYCVLRSPHVDKDSREHFEIRRHKRILDINYNPDIPVFDLLAQTDLPPGIFYRICLS